MSDNAYEEVKKVVDTYIHSVITLDSEMMLSVTHKDGRMFIGGTDTSKNLLDHWAPDNKRFSLENKATTKMYCKLLGLMVEGDIALARIRLNKYIDHYNLVKTSNGWRIVNKLSTYVGDP